MSLTDLQTDEVLFRKFKSITEDLLAKIFLNNFYDMNLTHEKMCFMVKNWQTVIEGHVVV